MPGMPRQTRHAARDPAVALGRGAAMRGGREPCCGCHPCCGAQGCGRGVYSPSIDNPAGWQAERSALSRSPLPCQARPVCSSSFISFPLRFVLPNELGTMFNQPLETEGTPSASPRRVPAATPLGPVLPPPCAIAAVRGQSRAVCLWDGAHVLHLLLWVRGWKGLRSLPRVHTNTHSWKPLP